MNNNDESAGIASPAAHPASTGPSLQFAIDFIEQRASDYLRDNAGTDPDTGDTVWHYGDAGRDYHSGLVELAEDLRSATPAPASTGEAKCACDSPAWCVRYKRCHRIETGFAPSPVGGSADLTDDIVGAICDAYESGVGHGLQKDGKRGNYYATDECNQAYRFGYDFGEDRADRPDAASRPAALAAPSEDAKLRAEYHAAYGAAWMHGGRVGGTIPTFEEFAATKRATPATQQEADK